MRLKEISYFIFFRNSCFCWNSGTNHNSFVSIEQTKGIEQITKAKKKKKQIYLTSNGEKKRVDAEKQTKRKEKKPRLKFFSLSKFSISYSRGVKNL